MKIRRDFCKLHSENTTGTTVTVYKTKPFSFDRLLALRSTVFYLEDFVKTYMDSEKRDKQNNKNTR